MSASDPDPKTTVEPYGKIPGDIVPFRGCWAFQDHVLTYNRYTCAIQCARCGEVFIRYLREIKPGVWIRDTDADPYKQ